MRGEVAFITCVMPIVDLEGLYVAYVVDILVGLFLLGGWQCCQIVCRGSLLEGLDLLLFHFGDLVRVHLLFLV